MKKQIVVLGCGRVGAAIVRDLAVDGDIDVLAVDASEAALEPLAAAGIATERADLAERLEVERLAGGADVVVGAVPGALGHQTLAAVIEAGRDYVDISFFPEDPLGLDALARKRGVTALVDCGLAPGLSNLLLGRMEREMDRVERFRCLVGGLPVERVPPFEYKAMWSPADVIEEYVRPARFREAGKEVVRPALSEVELVELPGVGTLEAFNSDGLRSLLDASDVPWMVEKTLRYPGHAALMEAFREAGLFGTEPVEVDGVTVVPRALTSALLFRAWHFEPGEADLSVLRVEVEGKHGGRAVRRTFDMLDRYDAATGTSSMARTTGYTCAAIARLVLEGWRSPGVAAPEIIGRDEEAYSFVVERLAERGIGFEASE